MTTTEVYLSDGAPAVVHLLYFCFHSLRQVVFGRPRFRFPSRVQWIATLVMELASLRRTYPIQRHRFLVMNGLHILLLARPKRSRLETVLGQKIRWNFLRLAV